jgi:CDP-6-deoxy-D-xylo-4-hexulose-3-dehydrase
MIPVFLDVELGTYNIDTSYLKGSLSKKTKAIMLPHVLGNPNDMDVIMEFVKDNDLYLIEDCCDALDSKYGGKMCGSFGDISTFSFYPAHHITTGEGGSVATNDIKIKKTLRSLRDWGKDCWCEAGESDACKSRFKMKFNNLPLGYDHKYVYSNIGYNLKPLDIQAAIGIEQLKKLPEFTMARKRNFSILHRELSEVNDSLILPSWSKKSDVSWFAFPITVNSKKFKRTDLVTWLEKHNIETRMLFGGNIIRQPAYEKIKYRKIGKLENSDRVMNDTFFVGVYPGLTEEMMNYMADKIKEFIRKNM